MDVIDRAQHAEDVFRSDALARRERRARPGPERSECADCGEAIGAARLAAVPGAQRCIDCQQQWEHRHG